jgi:hypothetical protein
LFDLDLTALLAAKGGRPLGVMVTLSAIVLPSSLLIYLTRPDLFQRYGIGGGLLFGAAVGFPIVFACCWPWYVLSWATLRQEEISRRAAQAFSPVQPPSPTPTAFQKMTAEDPLEWPVLIAGGMTANVVLYSLAARAYYRPLLLGATLLLTVGIIIAVWLVLAVLLNWGIRRLERQTNEAIAKLRQTIQTMPGGGS